MRQSEATLRQTEAQRELAARTWARDSVLLKDGWITRQQGDTDQANLAALTHAVEADKAAVNAQKAQIQVLEQQKDYLRVVAPFDGVVTQRNVDVGSLVQADATCGTFCSLSRTAMCCASSSMYRSQLLWASLRGSRRSSACRKSRIIRSPARSRGSGSSPSRPAFACSQANTE